MQTGIALGGGDDAIGLRFEGAALVGGFETESGARLFTGFVGGHAVQGDSEKEVGEVGWAVGQSELVATGEKEARIGSGVIEGANDGGDGGDEIGFQSVAAGLIFFQSLFEIVDD